MKIIHRILCRLGIHQVVNLDWEARRPISHRGFAFMLIPMRTTTCIHCDHTETREIG